MNKEQKIKNSVIFLLFLLIESNMDQQQQSSFKVMVPKTYPVNKWWRQYSKALFILARTYDPDFMDGISRIEGMQKMFDFLTAVVYMMPDPVARQYCIDFLYMKEYVAKHLVNRLPKFFYAYPQYYDLVLFQGASFLNTCLNSSSALFNWVYLLQAFLFMKMQDSGIEIPIPSLNEVRDLYHIDKLSIDDWGNNIWFILHTASLYAPEPIHQSFLNYRIMLESLQYLLPCPKCRNHLRANLMKISLGTCAKTREALFTCSWELHNIVNKDTKKPILELEEAVKLYV